MRRKEREISDIYEIDEIIRKAQVCRLGLSVDNMPYIVPMNFGYNDNCLYFHCAKEGKKIDMINQNSNVCFELDIDNKLEIEDELACKWTMKYRSIIGTGKAVLIEDYEEQKKALDIIMKHYSSKKDFQYNDKIIGMMTIIKVSITKMTGKKYI